MHKHLLATTCLVFVWIWSLQAQQVLSSGGGSFQSTEATMTFTIGETVISSFINPNATLTQGFNQAQLAAEIQVLSEAGPLTSGAELLFATVEPDGSSTLLLTIRNTGNDPLGVSALNFNGDPVFSIDGPPILPLVLPVGTEQVLTLRFSPAEVSDYTGQLSMEHTDTDASPWILNLRASAVIFDLPVMPLGGILLLSLSLLGLAVRSIRSF